MIKTKKELNLVLRKEKFLYCRNDSFSRQIVCKFCYWKDSVIWSYQRLLRITEYHKNNKTNSPYHKIMYAIYTHKLNKLGVKLGIELWENVFDVGLKIHHPGYIVVSGMAKVGKNCQLHGNNCIGNNGVSDECPVIGDNVEIGAGAIIIGNITIANNIKIAAGAVVVHSFIEPGITIAGVPAKKVSK